MRKTALLGLSLLLVLFTAGCKSAGNDSGSGIEGTWVSGTTTLVITASTVTGTDTIYGTATMSIDNNDTKAGHLLLTVTAASGVLAVLAPVGTIDYVTYKLDGNTLYYDGSTSAYPATATTPYTRQ